MERLSFVIPCYNSECTIGGVVEEIVCEMKKVSEKYDYEIILVNDGSKDKTMQVLKKLHDGNPKIVVADMIRNFGQPSAQMAGFALSKGNYILSFDDDGQAPIESIIPLVEKLKEGYDLVFGKWEEVKQSFFRRFGSKVNAKMAEIMIGKPKNLFMSSFMVTTRVVIDEIIKYQGPYPYIGGLLLRVTQNATCIDVKQRERAAGKSNYTFRKLVRLWMNGFTAFSILPLRVASVIGLICSIVGLIGAVYFMMARILKPSVPLGYASTIVAILFMGGILMMLLGMIGEYIGRIYLTINQTPQYILREIKDKRKWGEVKNATDNKKL